MVMSPAFAFEKQGSEALPLRTHIGTVALRRRGRP